MTSEGGRSGLVPRFSRTNRRGYALVGPETGDSIFIKGGRQGNARLGEGPGSCEAPVEKGRRKNANQRKQRAYRTLYAWIREFGV